MADEKPVLIYVPGRGRAELLRLTMAACGIDFVHGPFVSTPEHLKKLRDDGKLAFDQLPLVLYKGMHMVQHVSTAKYFAQLGGLMGSTAEETFRINMMADGAQDFFMGTFLMHGFGTDEAFMANVDKACSRYMPVFEKQLSTTGFVAGDKLTFADVPLLNALLALEERKPHEYDKYPKCKAHLEKLKANPSIKTYLESDKRFGPNTPEYIKMVMYVFS